MEERRGTGKIKCRGVFITASNIHDGVFSKNNLLRLIVNYLIGKKKVGVKKVGKKSGW